MSHSQHLKSVVTAVNEDLLEKVILQNDLAGLSGTEKVQHVKNVCESLGLNPLTKPIQLHKFQGKEVMYMSKDGAEQLRNLHDVSIIKLETEILNGDLYIVKAYATKPSGRQDCSTSAISIANLKGEGIGNAMKKCETQAKRRVTLSICGLGMMDESEIADLPKDLKPIITQVKPKEIECQLKPVEEFDEKIVDDILHEIDLCKNMDELRDVYAGTIKNKALKNNRDAYNKIIAAKDAKKSSLTMKEFNDEYDAAEYETETNATKKEDKTNA